MPAKRDDITDEGVTRLASYGCTQQEIADFYGCVRATITGRFGQAWTLGRSKVQKNIRMWQIRNARKGSDNMLIHLGKHYCGQHDKNASQDNLDNATATNETGEPVEP